MMMELMPVWLQAGAGNPLREFLLENILTGLSEAWRPLVADLLTWSLTCALIMGIVQVTMLYCTLLERKFVGRIQDRIGPNRVGYWGLLQPFADMVKMLTKEDITPAVAHRSVYNLGAILVVPPAIMVFAILPLSLGLVASDLSVGFLYFISVASVVIVPIFMAGWGSRNKFALIGAMRAVAQTVSYEIPQVLSVVGVLLLAGSLSTGDIILAQGTVEASQGFPGGWFILTQPIAFVIYLM
ncbi:MAG TPA: NADH-quinone oxidoreductase subunit H, partial [Anaerolineae bacterium]|nr:NADH-quinone oxidoreductase subunit H [Anaerolineae bacterium]